MQDVGADSRRPAGVDDGPVKVGDLVEGRFRVEELLGVGGMGAVYAARDDETGRQVALKVMRRRGRDAAAAAKRFLREARAARALESVHVARVEHVGELSDGSPFMLLEHLTGRSLDRLIEDQGPLSIPRAIDYVLQACEGVAEAHRRGIVHRDLKPSNLFVTGRGDGSDLIKVLDFGIAKHTIELHDDTTADSLTRTGAFLGSPEYVSPEQIRSSKHVDGRSDIWSLGLILFRLLTARPAFEADDALERLSKIVAEQPTRLRTYRPDAPQELEQALLKCLRKDPQRRFQDVSELARALAPYGSAGARGSASRIAAVVAAATSKPWLGASQESDELPTCDDDAVPMAPLHLAKLETMAGETLTLPLDEERGRPWWHLERGGRHFALALVVAGAAVVVMILSWSFGETPAAGVTPKAGEPAAAQRADTEGSRLDVGTASPGTEAASRSVTVEVQAEPADAEIWIDGRLSPARVVTLPVDDEVHEIRVAAPGFESATQQLVARRDTTIVVILEPQKAGRTRQSGPGRGTGRRGSQTRSRPAPSADTSGKVELQGPMESTL